MNGAGPIHDWEFALIGATTESVARYIQTGEFGLWQETGRMNDVIRDGAADGLGLGEALGRAILDGAFPAQGRQRAGRGGPAGRAGDRPRRHRLRHPARAPQLRRRRPGADQLPAISSIFAEAVTRLEGGVLLNFGSAVMGPEVYLKALAMARNVAHQEGRVIRHFTTGGLRPGAAGRRHAPAGAQERSALLLPALEDDPGPHRGRRRRELLRPGRPPRYRARTCTTRPVDGRDADRTASDSRLAHADSADDPPCHVGEHPAAAFPP